MPQRPARTSEAQPAGAERRQHARATADWPVLLDLPKGKTPARLRDISAAGVSFFLDEPIPEMTVLALELQFGTKKIQARGAVVRCERISPHIEHYEIALFLHEIGEADRDTMARYVASMLKPTRA
jgi:hypothetical protein